MAKLCILMAEDDADQRELYTYILEMNGFEVRSVANGKEAFAELHQNPPDLILTDIAMPEMSGLELMKAVREDDEFSHVPIILMSSFEGGSLTLSWIEGASGVIAKPFQPDDLFETILKVLPASRGH